VSGEQKKTTHCHGFKIYLPHLATHPPPTSDVKAKELVDVNKKRSTFSYSLAPSFSSAPVMSSIVLLMMLMMLHRQETR
jgi:hypothetical protein